MNNQGKYRRTGTVVRARRPVRAKKTSFALFKFFFLFLIGVIVLGGGILVISKGYTLLTHSDIAHWSVKSVQVSGVSGHMHRELLSKGQAYQDKRFTVGQSVALRGEIVKQYPMLKDVSVSRGLLSGKLKISAELRRPVAKFRLADGSVRLVDEDSVVYTDSDMPLLSEIPTVELVGSVPQRLQPDFVELVQDALKLDRKLKFDSLVFDLQHNTISMVLPDKSTVYFGSARLLKQKAQRASQMMAYAREHRLTPVKLNFDFFEDGKVFLTQASH